MSAMRIIDLSMPIGAHFRWNPEVQVKGDIAAGDQFRITRISTTCHGFTHVDAPAHFVAHAPTIEATPLDRVVGPCRVLDLRDAPANAEIGPETLAAADPVGGARNRVACRAARPDAAAKAEAWDLAFSDQDRRTTEAKRTEWPIPFISRRPSATRTDARISATPMR